VSRCSVEVALLVRTTFNDESLALFSRSAAQL
jgi:hypothetical protein